MSYTLGVDLGTTFTAAATFRDGTAKIVQLGTHQAAIPSAVYMKDDGTVLTGEAAERRVRTEPNRVGRQFKRRLGDTTPLLLGGSAHSAESLMAKLLRSVVDQVVESEGAEPDAIAVTHPANWGPYKTDLLIQAVQLAGLPEATLVTEPEAAAAFYASDNRMDDGDVIAVYDLGGGTFDVAVLRKTRGGFEILGDPGGIEHLGGIDFDAAVFGHVVELLGPVIDDLDEDAPEVVEAAVQLRNDCVAGRESLSADTDVSVPVRLPGHRSEIRLTREEFEAMVRPGLEDSLRSLDQTVQSASLTSEDITAVLLVGGASRTPLVAQMVGSHFGRPVAVDAHPKHAIALGAAQAAAGVADVADETPALEEAPAQPNLDEPIGAPPVAPPKQRMPVVALVLLAALVIGGTVFFVSRTRTDLADNADQSGNSTDGVDPAGSAIPPGNLISAVIDAGSMVRVNAEQVTIGTDDLAPTNDPPEFAAMRPIDDGVDVFVDVDNATNRQYYDFASWTALLPGNKGDDTWAELIPESWLEISPTLPSSFDDLGLSPDEPVQGLGFEAGTSFCTYALKRPITEIEWELAATSGAIDPSQMQNWVIDSAAYEPTPGDAPVLRGSIAGADLPVFHRTIGDSAITRANAGIRCAADEVTERVRPSGQILYLREFGVGDPVRDWPDGVEFPAPDGAGIGYHAPDTYHLETREPMAVGVGADVAHGDNVTISLETELKAPQEAGNFAYGLVANATSAGFLTFTLQPSAGDTGNQVEWCVARHTGLLLTTSFRVNAIPEVDACEQRGTLSSPEFRHTLSIRFENDEASFFVDDGFVAVQPAVPVPADGTFGIVVESFESDTTVHVHFDNLAVITN